MDEPPSYTLLEITFEQGLLYVLLTAAFLLLTAFASATEAAFFSLNSDDVDRLRRSNNESERIAVDLLVNPRLLLTVLTTCKYMLLSSAAILFVITFSSVFAIQYGLLYIFIAASLLTILFALFGVILPKIHGTTYNLSIVRRSSSVCKKLTTILKPVINPLLKMSEKVEKKMVTITEQNSVKELSHALQLATIENEPQEGEKEILAGIVNFGTLTVRQVMRPRSEISYTDISLSYHQLLEFVKKSGYSRIPICNGTIDKVEGILYIKDLLPFLDADNSFSWQKLLRPGYFVPELKKIDALLKDFQEKRVHLALVVGEQGAISGLITLEDVIEEIIGDINDEFDEVGSRFQKINDTTFLFDGKISIQEFCKIVNIDPVVLPVKGLNESLSGFLLEVNEKLPAPGDQITVEPFTFIVEAVDRKRIKRIKVNVHEPKET